MKGSLIIVGFFILGIVVGNADLAPALLRDSDVSFVALCGLLFCVGLAKQEEQQPYQNRNHFVFRSLHLGARSRTLFPQQVSAADA